MKIIWPEWLAGSWDWNHRQSGKLSRTVLKENNIKKAVSLLGIGTAVVLLAGCTKKTMTEPAPVEEPVPIVIETTAPSESPGAKPIEPFSTEAPDVAQETSEPKYDWEKTAIIATDIHYLAGSLTDGGNGFRYMVDHGDGKVVTYIAQIVDAFLAEVIASKPDMLILSGDLTLDGERKSHEELAAKLMTVKQAGIPVLVIPGNHDINNRHASEYRGDERLPAEYTTPEDFRRIYQEFGYNDAIASDERTLSYVYEVDEYNRLLMIDSCQYQPYAKVGGAILSDTYDWIEAQLEDAWDEGMNVIGVAHHNLLDESEIYVDDCTIEHAEQLVRMLDDWDVSLFLSGHLHVQHAKRSEDDFGIWEMVTSSLATPACQYGVLTFRDDASFVYQTQAVDVERWARRTGRSESDLLNFEAFKEPFLRRVFYNQSYDTLVKIESLTEKKRIQMSDFYSDLNYHYYQGTVYQMKTAAKQDPAYKMWMDEGGSTVLGDYVQYIIEDGKWDYNYIEEN